MLSQSTINKLADALIVGQVEIAPNVIQTVLQFVDTIVEHGKVYFADPVPVVEVAQTRTKRS